MIDAVRRSSPERYLRRHYQDVHVNERGDAISIEGVVRIDLKDGRWLARDWSGRRIGDTIDLVRFVQPGATFPDAVFELTGSGEGQPIRIAPARVQSEAVRRPSIPYGRGQAAGRAYLRDVHGISEASILHAERSGMLHYVDNGILFTGRDDAKAIRSAVLHHIRPVAMPDGTMITERDLADSDKGFPAVMPGSPARIVIVDGGVNALAVRDMAGHAGYEPPTVIAAGSAGVTSWLGGNAVIGNLLLAADRVEIMGEWESTPEKQAEADARRTETAAAVADIRNDKLPTVIMPPEGMRDMAEWNRIQQQPTSSQPDNPGLGPGFRV